MKRPWGEGVSLEIRGVLAVSFPSRPNWRPGSKFPPQGQGKLGMTSAYFVHPPSVAAIGRWAGPWVGPALLFWLLPRHFRSSWVLLSVTFCGVLAAVTVMAIGGIYSRALAEGGLQHSLASSSRSVLNVRLTIQNRPLGLADYADLRAGIEGIIEDRVAFLVTGLQRHGRTQPDLPLVLNPEEGVSFLGGPRGRPFFLTGFQEHSQLVEGRWPEANPEVHENGVDVEAVVGQSAAKTLDMHVGDRVHVLPFRSVEDQRIEITIVGLAEPVDTQEEYWMGSPVYFAVAELRGQSAGVLLR